MLNAFCKQFEKKPKKLQNSMPRRKKDYFDAMTAVTRMDDKNTKNKMNSLNGYSQVHAKHIDIQSQEDKNNGRQSG